MADVAKSAAAYLALVFFPPVLILTAMPASADEACNKPFILVNSLPMKPLERSGRSTIPVVLNGVEKQFLFDTGGFFTQVSPAVADELKLNRRQSDIELYGVDGSVSRSQVRLSSFAVGKLRAQNYDLLLGTDNDVDGIFSPVAYKNFDFEMDFAAGKLNIFSSDHCDGKVIYWPSQALAVVPVKTDDLHLKVPVTVDGHEMTAIIDTGARTSAMRLNIARYVFDLKPDSPDMKVIGHIDNDEKAPIYAHPFKTLSFEGVAVSNPDIAILTDVVNKNADHSYQTGSHIYKNSDDITLPEIIVGMDVLRELHLYLAVKEKRLYITEASAPADAAQTAAPASRAP